MFGSLLKKKTSSGLKGDVMAEVATLFDANFYIRNYPELDLDLHSALDHYIRDGWREGRDPSPSFATKFYLDRYPDVRYSGINPLVHFVLHGREEGRYGAPNEVPKAEGDEAEALHERVRSEFDTDFYLSKYGRALGARDAFQYFMVEGWRLGHDPNPNFSTSGYLAANPDVLDAGVNPLLHYLAYGMLEGRVISSDQVARRPETDLPSSSPAVADSDTGSQSAFNEVIAAIESHFDREFYLASYEDVKSAGVDPIVHYCSAGWKEDRDPSPSFSTRFYLNSNPDVKAAGINPYFHYIIAGNSEGRQPVAPGGYKAELLHSLKPLVQVVDQWSSGAVDSEVNGSDILVRRLRQDHLAGNQRILVSISHDNYTSVVGGVQLCVQREADEAARQRVTYLHLRPLKPLPVLATKDDLQAVVVAIVGGKEVGAFQLSDVVDALAEVCDLFRDRDLVIHHLLGHVPEAIAVLATKIFHGRCYFWLHDFFALCPSYALQRNTVTFCGAPPVMSNACGLCIYGEERLAHVKRIEAFFDALDVSILAPSDSTRSFWEAKSKYSWKDIVVIPHMDLHWLSNKRELTDVGSGAVRIAFTGTPAAHKGWHVFKQLVNAERQSSFYQFLYFGASPARLPGVTDVAVHVTSEDISAMIDALAARQIDYVIHWASWPETFSFSAHEALAAGAFVITNDISGNVAAAVRKSGRGVVMNNVDELVDFFDTGEALKLAPEIRRRRLDLEPQIRWSQMTFEVNSKEPMS